MAERQDGDRALTLEAGEEESWASSPAQYLEKIFQLVLTLPPLQTQGFQRMIHDLVGLPDSESARPRGDRGAPGEPAPPSAAPPGVGRAASAPERRLPLNAVPIVQRVDPFALTPGELRLMELLGPPLITSPRAVKRLANSYGLLASLSTDTGGWRADLLQPVPDLDGTQAHPYRAAMVLLGAVVGYPVLGPALFPHLFATARTALRTQQPPRWGDYLRSLRAWEGEDGTWTSPLWPRSISTGRAQHVNTLLAALDRVEQRAAGAAEPLTLPQDLRIWARWVVPVGRLSFPTGSAVSRLSSPDDTGRPGAGGGSP